MAAFRFRLEQVLSYRKRLEEEAMRALADANSRRDALLDRLEFLGATQAEQRERLCRAHTLTAAERWLIQSYLDILARDVEAAKEDLRAAEEEVDRCRGLLMLKAQERSLLDTLKEKQSARHDLLERQKEQREFDEIATLRYRPASF